MSGSTAARDGGATPIVLVYGGDLAWRRSVAGALRAAQLAVRIASRPAEVTKALADGATRLVLHDGPGNPAGVPPDLALLHRVPGESPDEVTTRVLSRLAEDAAR